MSVMACGRMSRGGITLGVESAVGDKEPRSCASGARDEGKLACRDDVWTSRANASDCVEGQRCISGERFICAMIVCISGLSLSM